MLLELVASAAPGGDAGGGGADADAPVRTATTGTVERGQYLVDHVLVCGVCHTPNGPDGKPVDDIVAALKTNTEKGTGRTFCNTHPGGPELYGKMTDGDMRDIATYIHTLPPVANGPFKCLP